MLSHKRVIMVMRSFNQLPDLLMTSFSNSGPGRKVKGIWFWCGLLLTQPQVLNNFVSTIMKHVFRILKSALIQVLSISAGLHKSILNNILNKFADWFFSLSRICRFNYFSLRGCYYATQKEKPAFRFEDWSGLKGDPRTLLGSCKTFWYW